MQKVIQHEKYGCIVYQENFWTGKPTVTINNTALKKINKRTFEYENEGTVTTVALKGSMLNGVQLQIGDDLITVQEKAKWYEYALSVLILVFDLVWGNVPALCAIFPLVGGAIGGFICGLFAVLNLFFMRKAEKIWQKLLIFLGFFAVSILCCYLIALAILAALA